MVGFGCLKCLAACLVLWDQVVVAECRGGRGGSRYRYRGGSSNGGGSMSLEMAIGMTVAIVILVCVVVPVSVWCCIKWDNIKRYCSTFCSRCKCTLSNSSKPSGNEDEDEGHSQSSATFTSASGEPYESTDRYESRNVYVVGRGSHVETRYSRESRYSYESRAQNELRYAPESRDNHEAIDSSTIFQNIQEGSRGNDNSAATFSELDAPPSYESVVAGHAGGAAPYNTTPSGDLPAYTSVPPGDLPYSSVPSRPFNIISSSEGLFTVIPSNGHPYNSVPSSDLRYYPPSPGCVPYDQGPADSRSGRHSYHDNQLRSRRSRDMAASSLEQNVTLEEGGHESWV